MKNFTAALADYAHAIELGAKNSSPVYNAACVHALQNEVEQSCIWLRRAIDMDKKYVEMARTDTDFDPIRETAEFKALMEEFGSNEKSTD